MRRVFSYSLLVHCDCNKGNKEILMGGFFDVALKGDCTSVLFYGIDCHDSEKIRGWPMKVMHDIAISEVSSCQK